MLCPGAPFEEVGSPNTVRTALGAVTAPKGSGQSPGGSGSLWMSLVGCKINCYSLSQTAMPTFKGTELICMSFASRLSTTHLLLRNH